jgi:Bacterial extracellular solute-binding proteins, family 3
MRIGLVKLVLIAVIGLLHQSVNAQLVGDTYNGAKKSKTATWTVTYSDSPGLVKMGADGKPEGVCVDLLQAFADYIKTKDGIAVTVKYEPTSTDFSQYLKNVKSANGGVFGLSNTTITKDRKLAYRFSPPFIKNVSMILSNSKCADVSDFKNLQTAFAGFTAITVKGSTNEGRLLKIKEKYFPALTIEYVASFTNIIDRVASDPKVFGSVDFTYYLKAVQAKKQIKRQPIGDEEGEEFGIIMPLSNDWNEQLNAFMSAEYVNGPKFKKIITTHLGQSVLKFTQKN